MTTGFPDTRHYNVKKKDPRHWHWQPRPLSSVDVDLFPFSVYTGACGLGSINPDRPNPPSTMGRERRPSGAPRSLFAETLLDDRPSHG